MSTPRDADGEQTLVSDQQPQTDHQTPQTAPEDLSGTEGPKSSSRRSCASKLPVTRAWKHADRLHVPDGLSNGKTGKRCAGLDPRDIDLQTLIAAGHGPKRTAQAVSEYRKIMGGDLLPIEGVRCHSDIRKKVCRFCVENMAEVKRCSTFWCSFWQFRMGGNPHRPKMTDEALEAARERGGKMREAQS